MAKKIRILILIPHLNAGGAAHVSINVARGLFQRGYDVHLAVIAGKPAGGAYPIATPVHFLGSSRVRWSAARLVRLVRTIRPHVLLSSMAHLNQFVLALRPSLPRQTRIIVRNDGGIQLKKLSRLRRSAFRILHSSADGIICQSEEMRADLAAELAGKSSLHILPNPVEIEEARFADWERPLWSGTGVNLLAVGRHVEQKGFDLLLQAFSLVAAQFPTVKLVMIGDGPKRSNLEALAIELGLTRSVHFAGEIRTPKKWFSGASAFVLSSREDAMPNALLEAAAAGLPIIATPARGGVPALLKNDPGSWIAPEISASSLAETLASALRVLAPGQRFEHPWIEPYAWPNAIDRYEELVRSIASSTE